MDYPTRRGYCSEFGGKLITHAHPSMPTVMQRKQKHQYTSVNKRGGGGGHSLLLFCEVDTGGCIQHANPANFHAQ